MRLRLASKRLSSLDRFVVVDLALKLTSLPDVGLCRSNSIDPAGFRLFQAGRSIVCALGRSHADLVLAS